MDKNFWIDPANTKVFAKNIPMKVFAAGKPGPRSASGMITKPTVGKIPGRINNLWEQVAGREFNAICWSQRRPVGPISVAIKELGYVLKKAKELFPGHYIAFVCHSRGGLVARKFMEKRDPLIKALITIATPHQGSALPSLGRYLSPLKPAMEKLLPDNVHDTASEVLKRVSELIEGSALKELSPGSDFLETLKDSPCEGVTYISFGGTMTKLITVYSWKRKEDRIYPAPLMVIPDSLTKILPASIIPDEVTPGMGDFMVTSESSVLPWASKHYDLQANHISIIWHKKTINNTIEVLEAI